MSLFCQREVKGKAASFGGDVVGNKGWREASESTFSARLPKMERVSLKVKICTEVLTNHGVIDPRLSVSMESIDRPGKAQPQRL